MKVYRLEDPKTQKGPYAKKLGYTSHAVRIAHNYEDDGSHPGPEFFSDPLWMKDSERSACESLDDLIDWFEPFTDGLLDEGYDVVELDIPNEYVRVCSNSRQLVFNISGREDHHW